MVWVYFKLIPKPLVLRSTKVKKYHRLGQCGSIWTWLCFSWQFPVGWCGPHIKVYEYGRRICGWETRWNVAWPETEEDPQVSLLPPRFEDNFEDLTAEVLSRPSEYTLEDLHADMPSFRAAVRSHDQDLDLN
jgi:hypothetical protein